MVANHQPKVGTWGHNDTIFVPWLDVDTGERGADYFDMDALCRLGYGDMHLDDDFVVMVRTVQVGRVER